MKILHPMLHLQRSLENYSTDDKFNVKPSSIAQLHFRNIVWFLQNLLQFSNFVWKLGQIP